MSFLIVKYKTFNIKLFATEALVWGLTLLIGSQFFFIKTPVNYVLNSITFIGVIIFGRFLVKSVKKEIDQRERLENLRLRLEKSNLDLEIANDKLKDLDKLKTEFVSLASHQLRSPLTAIKGYLSMIVEGDYGDINPEAKEAISKVSQSSNNLTLVVEDLLNVSKIESGGMKYEIVKFDFGEIVISTVGDLSITAEKKGLKLVHEIKEGEKYFVDGDKDKLRQVLVNLIDNSIKYTAKGQIVVNLENKDGKIILSIKDTGAGVEEKMKKTIFEKFSRGDGSKLNASGSGLGLYLVKELVEAHHGRVWVESEGLGKGATFLVELDEAK
jgi:signal transduction histidine kinase